MAKITLIYDDTGLTVNIIVKNKDTITTDFSGVMTEIDNGFYVYEFAEAPDTDYIYIASTAGKTDMKGEILREKTISIDVDEIATAVDTKITESHGSGSYTQQQVTVNGGINIQQLREELIRIKGELAGNKAIYSLDDIITYIRDLQKEISFIAVNGANKEELRNLKTELDSTINIIKEKDLKLDNTIIKSIIDNSKDLGGLIGEEADKVLVNKLIREGIDEDLSTILDLLTD